MVPLTALGSAATAAGASETTTTMPVNDDSVVAVLSNIMCVNLSYNQNSTKRRQMTNVAIEMTSQVPAHSQISQPCSSLARPLSQGSMSHMGTAHMCSASRTHDVIRR